MDLNPLGSTGLLVSSVAYGTAPLGQLFGRVDEAVGLRSVHQAFDLGITFFDTSPYYGDAEERLGRALQGRRDSVVLGTKAGRDGVTDFDFSPQHLRGSVEKSLRLLQTDYVDILQLHDVDFVPLGPVLEDSYAELVALKDAGKCRAIGMTGYSLATSLRVLTETDVDVLLNFCHGTLLDNSIADVLGPVADERGVGLINAAAVALGLLTSRGKTASAASHLGTERTVASAKRMIAICETANVDVAFVANQYAIQRSGCPTTVIGTTNEEHLRSAVEAASAPIDDEIVSALLLERPDIALEQWSIGRAENR
jgi:L-galactose dehydrogenase